MTTANKKTDKQHYVGVVSLSLLSMVTVGLNTGLAAVSEAFPDAGMLMVQICANAMSLVVIAVSFFVNRLYALFTRKRTVIAGEMILIATALCAYIYHPSILSVMVYSSLVGVSAAIILPGTGSAVIDCFSVDKRPQVSGRQSIMSSIGGIIFSLLGGYLAGRQWYATYLVFFLAVPVLVLTCTLYPEDRKNVSDGGKQKFEYHPAMLKYGLTAVLYVVLFGVFMSNIAMFIVSEGIGSQTSAGIAASCSMFGGMFGGLLFRRIYTKLHRRVFILTFTMGTVSLLMLYMASSLYRCMLAGLLIGMFQSIHLPSCLLALGEECGEKQSVSAALIVSCLAANIGTLLSPILFTGILGALGWSAIRMRFLSAAVLGMLLILTSVVLYSNKTERSSGEV